jgi:uncharacterized RDD family membrane protein YckC
VTCPKCGFVSYPELTQCKKCGYRFAPAGAKSERPDGVPPTATDHAPKKPAASVEFGSPHTPPQPAQPGSPSAPVPADHPEINTGPISSPSPNLWREELAERLQDHRRRRSRPQEGFDRSGTLDLAFEEPAEQEPAGIVDAQLIESPETSEESFDARFVASHESSPSVNSVPFERQVENLRVLTSAAVDAGEAQLGQAETDSGPVEIVLESPSPASRAASHRRAAGSLEVAPLGLRFAAAVVDTIVLLSGGALFSLIFWVVGGHVSVNPLNLAILGSITTLFLLAYFGIFTALSSSTPGLLWMNLEVRSLDGGAPTPRESFWRAFGYLISGASLMLGFIWAAMDGDHLTWHDHMSGTFITGIGS